jgi:hypothetical protein
VGLVVGVPQETQVGTALLLSKAESDGTIRIVVPKSVVGNPQPGDLLGAVNGRTFSDNSNVERSTTLIDHTFIKAQTDNAFPAATYTVVGNTACAGPTPTPTPSPSPTPTPTLAVVQFSSSTYAATEGCTKTTVTVQRLGLTTGTTTVDYVVSDGSAKQKSDYEFAAGRLVFAPGDTSKSFDILVNDDGYVEGTETATITFSKVSGALVGQPSQATLQINDNDTSAPPGNVIDDPATFVCQHYHDFLNRQGDSGGQDFWTGRITVCGTDAACIRRQRIGVSAQFFIEQEFQVTGFYVYRVFKASLGRRPSYVEFMTDWSRLLANPSLSAEQIAYSLEFVQRSEFTAKYASATTGPAFVDALLQTVQANSGLDLTSKRSELLAEYSAGTDQTDSRARTLRKLVDYTEFKNAEFNRAFVLSQYFNYLRREPDTAGYNFWLNNLNSNPSNFRGMVCVFITSAEYQDRFGAVRTHDNTECNGSP